MDGSSPWWRLKQTSRKDKERCPSKLLFRWALRIVLHQHCAINPTVSAIIIARPIRHIVHGVTTTFLLLAKHGTKFAQSRENINSRSPMGNILTPMHVVQTKQLSLPVQFFLPFSAQKHCSHDAAQCTTFPFPSIDVTCKPCSSSHHMQDATPRLLLHGCEGI
jgi:hypothetical protein